jgi:hypothetical protein
MAGPWEMFQQSPADNGPWTQFQTAAPMQDKPQISDLDRRMDERVANEVKRGSVPRPQVAEYLPFGSLLDEVTAGIQTGLGKISGGVIGEPSYEEAKAYQNARQRYIAENSSGLEKGLAMAGGVAASLPLGAVRTFTGTTMLPQIGNAAITGGLYGGLYGVGEGDSLGERALNTAKGAGIGIATGAVAVPVARGIGNAVSYARNRMTPVQPALQGMERGAVNRVADDIGTSGLTRQGYAQQAQELGPQGMLLDMGDDLRGSAEVLAQTRGPQLPVVRGNLNDRRNTAPDRIRQGVSQELGQEMNLPRYVENVTDAHNRAAKPFYDAFYASNVPVSENLQAILSAAKASGAYDAALKKMIVKRLDPNLPQNNGQFLDLIKRELDGIAGAAKNAGNRTDLADYSKLARDLRGEVDSALSPSDPTQSAWARARSIAGDGLEGEEAAALGAKVFSGKRDPHIVDSELQGMSQLGQNLYRYGARNDVRQIMGRAATNFGPRGDNAGRKAFNNEFARENLTQIAGPQNAQRLTNMIDAENRMAESFNEIMTNSATARRQAGQSRLPMGAGPPVRTEAPRSFGEAAYSIARRGVNALANGALGERAGRIMRDQARLLSARGIDRDIYVQALMQLADDRQTTNQGRQVIEQMINAVTQNSRTPLIEGVVSSRSDR